MDFPGSRSHVIPRPAESRPAHRSALNSHGDTTEIVVGIPLTGRFGSDMAAANSPRALWPY